VSGSTREPPPEGFPWDAPIADAPLAFVDLEMTGLEPKRHRVIQICIERVVGGDLVERLLTFVHPGDAPIGGTEVHGIAAEDLQAAPRFAAIVEDVARLFEGAILVAHGARWDIAFLSAEHARLDRPWHRRHYLDTLALARRTIDAPRHGLAPLAQHLGIDNPQPHRADNDVRVTRALFDLLSERIDPPTPRALWELGVGRRRVRPEILDRADQALVLRRTARVCYRPCGKAPQELTFHVTEVRRDLDPPVVLGYLLDTRGRRELRADRILSLSVLDDETAS